MKVTVFHLNTCYAEQLDSELLDVMSLPVRSLYTAFKAIGADFEVTNKESLNTCYLTTVAFDTDIVRVPCMKVILKVPDTSSAHCPAHLNENAYQVGIYLAAEAVAELPF